MPGWLRFDNPPACGRLSPFKFYKLNPRCPEGEQSRPWLLLKDKVATLPARLSRPEPLSASEGQANNASGLTVYGGRATVAPAPLCPPPLLF